MNAAPDSHTQAAATIGFVVAPGAPADAAAGWTSRLAEMLNRDDQDITWTIEVEVDGLVEPRASTMDLVREARRLLLDRSWDLVVVITDMPITVGRRPAASLVAATHSVGVISWPSLGATRTSKRATASARAIVDELVGLSSESQGHRRGLFKLHTRRRRPTSPLGDDHPDELEWSGYVRLVAGMVATNRPWRVALTLTRSVSAALATVLFALITPDIWALSAQAGPGRQALLTFATIAVGSSALIIRHQLWERSGSIRGDGAQVALFNLVTVVTVVLGFAVMYVALAAIALVASVAIIDPSAIASGIGVADAGLGDYLSLAWFTSSLATLGGAVGSGLETDDAITEAAYGTRPGRGGGVRLETGDSDDAASA